MRYLAVHYCSILCLKCNCVESWSVFCAGKTRSTSSARSNLPVTGRKLAVAEPERVSDLDALSTISTCIIFRSGLSVSSPELLCVSVCERGKKACMRTEFVVIINGITVHSLFH